MPVSTDRYDAYRLYVPDRRTVQIDLDLSALPPGADFDVAIYDGNHPSTRLLAEDRVPGRRFRTITVTDVVGTHYVVVRQITTHGDHPYELRWISARRPRLQAPDDGDVLSVSPAAPGELRWDEVIGEQYEVFVHNFHERNNWNRTFTTPLNHLSLPTLDDGEYWYKVRATGSRAFTNWSEEYMFFLTSDTLVKNVRAASCLPYVTGRLASGNMYYVDREYRIDNIPSALTGATWIRTHNDDKRASDDEFLHFEAVRPVDVFVAYDLGEERISRQPDWLTGTGRFEGEGFASTGLKISVVDSDGKTSLSVFRRRFPAGLISLGGNLAEGVEGAGSNYVVLVSSREG